MTRGRSAGPGSPEESLAPLGLRARLAGVSRPQLTWADRNRGFFSCPFTSVAGSAWALRASARPERPPGTRAPRW